MVVSGMARPPGRLPEVLGVEGEGLVRGGERQPFKQVTHTHATYTLSSTCVSLTFWA